MRGFFFFRDSLKPDDRGSYFVWWESGLLILLLCTKHKQQQVQCCVSTFEGVTALGYVNAAEMEKCLFLERQLFESDPSSYDPQMILFLIY